MIWLILYMFEIKGILRGIRREHIGSSITVHSVSYPMPYRICFTKIRRKWLISDFIPKNSEKSKFSQKFIDENRKWSPKIFFFISGEIQFWRNFQKRTLKLCFGTPSQKLPLKIKKNRTIRNKNTNLGNRNFRNFQPMILKLWIMFYFSKIWLFDLF